MNFLEALFCGFVALALIGHISMGTLPAYGEVEVVYGKGTSLPSPVDNYTDYRISTSTASLHRENNAICSNIPRMCCGIMASKPGCKLEKGTGVFPQCCYKSVCSKTN
ncbi:secreted salivary gland peptide, putative [Ixodes scapularis]|uniref:Secreted salivary gland peptide, putative n=1 Tax=Ixodes scapularis TaxID=6945 RepID=B7PS55_IXOSC|nr:secreted salivary gland peptide, putative [Ixodes scapularis]|eukprot:XP_002402007.1 secreted salivary gland peptide, putative [Ixodes scapularis]